MTKAIVKIGMGVLITLLALLVLWQFRMVVIYVLASIALAAALRPLVKSLSGRRIIVRVGLILLFLVVLGGFVFLLFRTVASALNEIQQLAQSVSVRDKWRLPFWLEGTAFQQVLMERLPAPSKLFEAITGDQGQLVLPTILGVVQGVGGAATAILLVLFLSLYWSLNQIHFERLWLSLLPSDQRKQTRGIWRTIEPDIGAYIRSEVIESFLAGLLFGFGCWLIGSPYSALLAIVGALACLIPMVGAAIAIFVVLVVGLLTSVQIGLFTALYALAFFIALDIWVKPRLFNRRWDNPILTVVLLIALADAFGLVGIIVAPPISAICQILWSRLVSHQAVSGAAIKISDLKERQARVQDLINAMEEPRLSLVTSSMERLSHLIKEAEPFLETDPSSEPSEPLPSPPSTSDDEGNQDPQNPEENNDG